MFRAFTDHPASVGETYLEHLSSASWFALTMFVGAAVCLLHAIFPFAFQKGGSRRIKLLHERMVTNRHRAPDAQGFLGYAEGILSPCAAALRGSAKAADGPELPGLNRRIDKANPRRG